MFSPVEPPACVRGMMKLDKEAFKTSSSLPILRIQADRLNTVKKYLEKFCVKISCFKSVQDSEYPGRKIVVLNPRLVRSFSDLSEIERQLTENQVSESDFESKEFEFGSENWRPHEKLKYILAEQEEGVTGFSIIGHILHLNLKENLVPFKSVIGEVLLETKNIRTVVTKTSNIDNTFRNFELEVLAGEKDFLVDVRENGVNFRFDFSKVYWNPRLSTEHERIVKKLKKTSVLFDACAGVGPFSIPAAKKCRVFANDLNPESFRWLKENVSRNKIKPENMSCYNLDARDFIRQVLVAELGRLAGQEDVDVHVTMNLPALAVTFLDVFQGLLADSPELNTASLLLPQVHVYTFSKAENTEEDVRSRVEASLGVQLDSEHLTEIAFVRNVAPSKDMLRASFFVPKSLLFQSPAKRKLEKENMEQHKKVKD